MKIYDIEFKKRSAASDFGCPDGEIASGAGDMYWDSVLKEAGLPEPQFALSRTTLSGWHLIADSFPTKSVVASDPSMDYWNGMAAQVLSQLQNDASNRGLFVAPFWITGGWRMTDGTLVCLSEPMMLIPNSGVPLVFTDGDIAAKELDMKVAAAICSLKFRLGVSEALRAWVGKIASLDILVSDPAVRYDSYHAFIPSRSVRSEAWCESLDEATGEVTRKRVTTEVLPLAWRANEEAFKKAEEPVFRVYASVPLSELDLAREWTGVYAEARTGVFAEAGTYPRLTEAGTGIYAEAGTHPRLTEAGTLPRLNTGKGLIIEGRGESVDITTRPLKLNGAGNFKTVSTIFLRGNYTPGNITMSVYASRDMLKWWKVAVRKGGAAVMLPRTSFRFFKLRIQGFLGSDETLEGISVSVTASSPS